MYNHRIFIIGIMVSLISTSIITFIPMVNSNPGTWTITRLTDNSVFDMDVHISADGSKIVYVEDLDGMAWTANDREIMLLDLDTMHIKRLTDNIYPDYRPSITEDGSKIIFTELIGYKEYICSINSDGSGFRIISEGILPYVSPDGSKIAYVSEYVEDLYYNIGIMNSDGTNKISVTHGYYSDYPVITNRDGSKLAFCRNNDDVSTLYVIRSDGTNLKAISEVAWFSMIGMSDDGSKIVYTKEVNENGETQYKAALYDTSSNTETLLDTRKSGSVAISGDGSQTAYFYANGGKEYIKIVNGDEIYVGEKKDAYALYYFNSFLSINRDGSKIAFMSWVDGNPEIYLATKEGFSLPSSSLIFTPIFYYPYPTIIFGSDKSPLPTVTIPITIKRASGIGSMNLVLTYNSDILNAIDVIPGALTQNSIIEKNLGDGEIRIGLIDTNGINGNGTLFYIKFNVTKVSEGSSVNNSSSISIINSSKFTLSGSGLIDTPSLKDILRKQNSYSPLNIESAIVSDLNGDKITVLTVNGTFTVGSEKGDVNGDGEITSVDALMALKMSVGELEVNLVADMDDDGQVLANDALQIMNIATQHNLQQMMNMFKNGGLNFGGFGGD